MTVDPYKIIDKIKKALNDAGYLLIVLEIEERIAAGSSGTEILMSVAHYLKHLGTTNSDAGALISNDVNELIRYLDSIGLIIT